jgi:hypothetical protein
MGGSVRRSARPDNVTVAAEPPACSNGHADGRAGTQKLDRARIRSFRAVLAPKAGKANDIEHEAFGHSRQPIETPIQAADATGGYSGSGDEVTVGVTRPSTQAAADR